MIIVMIALIFIGGYFLQAYLYEKKCLNGVSIELNFKENGIFEGERTQLIETIENRKWLFLWWLIVRFKISKNIKFEKDQEGEESVGDAKYRRDLFSLSSYQRVRRHFDITALKRGYYTIEGANVTAGDIFASSKYLIDIPLYTSLYVYPSLVNSGEFSIPFEKMMGEIMTRRRLIEDPFQIRGIRDYSQYDSLKKVNWNATARTGELKVNEYDFTSSQEIMIFINVDRYNDWQGEENIEESIRIGATIASECMRGGIPVGLVSNGCSVETGKKIEIESSNSPDYSVVFYQNLAGLDIRMISEPFHETLKEVIINGNKEPLYILISQHHGELLQQEVENAKMNGFNIYWILPKGFDDKVDDIKNRENLFIWEVRQR